ncbi:hypothetical protein THAOC_07969, partial [Thalassiosira oceanica]
MPQCLSQGYFPTRQGAIRIPPEGREACIRSPQMFSSERKKELLSNEKKEIFLYPWHFFKDHLKCTGEGTEQKWSLDYERFSPKKAYQHPNDGERYDFPPPRMMPRDFCNQEFETRRQTPPVERWVNYGQSMPEWLWDILILDEENSGNGGDESPRKKSKLQAKTPAQLEKEVKMWKRRSLQQHQKSKEAERKHNEEVEMLNQKFARMVSKEQKHKDEVEKLNEKFSSMVLSKDEVIERQRRENEELKKIIADLQKELKETKEELERCRKAKGKPLCFDDLFE